MCIDDIPPKHFTRAVTAIVRSLGCREAADRPAIRPSILIQHGVFLLKAEPELVTGVLGHEEVGIVAEVVLVGLAVGHVGFADDEDVVTPSEGVWVVCSGAEVDVRVVAGGLVGG